MTDYEKVFLKRYWQDESFREFMEKAWKKEFFDSREERILFKILFTLKKAGKTNPLKNDLLMEVKTKSKYESVRKALLEVIDTVDNVDLSQYTPDIIEDQFRDIAMKKQLQAHTQISVEETSKTGKIDFDKLKKSYEDLLAMKEYNGEEKHSSFTTKLADIEKQEKEWLWKNYISIGDAALISGDPDTGKTWIALHLASIVSRGKHFPDGWPMKQAQNVMYLSTEDEPSTTIKGRVEMLHGDQNRFFVYHGEEKKEMLDLGNDSGLRRLETEIKRIGGIGLLVIDPIIDFSPKTNPNKNEEVRKLLEPLIELSRRLKFAMIILSHLNKNETEKAIYRASGTTGGWLGKCRSAFLVANDVDEEGNHIFHKLKANHAFPQPKDFTFKIVDNRLSVKMSDQRIDIAHHLNTNNKKPRERENAVEWIYQQFENVDEIPSAELEQRAVDEGISVATFRRAKNAKCGAKLKIDENGVKRWFTLKPKEPQGKKEEVLDDIERL